MTTAYEHETQLVGDDYQGLPTQTVKYRSKPKGSSIDWDQITENYIARGGQVDASVWPNHGKVIVSGSNSARSSRANIHTFTEASEYDEPAATHSNGHRIKVSTEQRPEIARRYTEGESVVALAKAYGVSEGSIRYAVLKAGGSIRSKAEAAALHRDRSKS